MSEAKHNPLPWEYENVQDCRERSAYGRVRDANGKILFDTINADVAEICEEYDEACVTRRDEVAWRNLSLVVKAVNAHAELLAALKVARDLLEQEYGNAVRNGYFPGVAPALQQVNEAIASAEGKP